MSLSPDQLRRRLDGMTATDIAAVVNLHPYRSPISVWSEKRGEAPPWIDTDRTRWGDLLEPVIRSDYATRHEVRVEVPGTLEHPDAPWMLATPDGVAYPIGGADPLEGLEIKCHTIRLSWMYGPPGTDEVPPHVLIQAVWGMAVTGLTRWRVIAFIDGQPREYVIDRDDELIGALQERAERFLVDNVRGGQPPDPDGSESYDEWLKGRWKKNTAELLDIGNDRETYTLIERAKAIREHGFELGVELETIVQTLKARVGDAGGLTWRDGNGKPLKVTWARNKPGKRTDHAGLANDMRQGAALLASAERPAIAQACAGLMLIGGHVGTSAMSGIAIAKLIERLRDKLVEISKTTDKAYTTETVGARPFVFPRSWSMKSDTEEKT